MGKKNFLFGCIQMPYIIVPATSVVPLALWGPWTPIDCSMGRHGAHRSLAGGRLQAGCGKRRAAAGGLTGGAPEHQSEQ